MRVDKRPRVQRLAVPLPERPNAALVRGFRVPGVAVAALVLLVLAVLMLAPTVSVWAEQRQRIADLEAQVAEQRRDLADLEAQRARWDDPAYIRAQAGSRLFYVLPGETTYRLTGTAEASTDAPVQRPSATVQTTRTDWAAALLGSLVEAGTSTATPEDLPTALPAE